MATTDPKSLLADVPIFTDLSARSLSKLSALCVNQSFDAGEVLIEQGGTGLGLFLITRGRVEVFNDEGGERVSIAVLERGQVVGEMSLLDDQPRSASVVALEPTEALLISRSAFRKLVRKEPEIAWCFVPVLVGRLREAQCHEHVVVDRSRSSSERRTEVEGSSPNDAPIEIQAEVQAEVPAAVPFEAGPAEVQIGPFGGPWNGMANGSAGDVHRPGVRGLLDAQHAVGRAGLALAEESVEVFGRMLDTWAREVGLDSDRPTSEVLRAMPSGAAKAWIAACRAAGGSPRRVLDAFRHHLQHEPDRSQT